MREAIQFMHGVKIQDSESAEIARLNVILFLFV